MKKAVLILSLCIFAGCDDVQPIASPTSVAHDVQVSAVVPVTSAPVADATPAPAAGGTCKQSFKMVPLNFQKQAGTLPEVLKVRFERLASLSDDVHVATFDSSGAAPPGRQRLLQVRSTRLAAEPGSTVQLEIPIDCGLPVQVDFGCGADAPPGAAYDGGSYNSHVHGMRECPTVAPNTGPAPAPAATPTPAPEATPTPAPTPAPSSTAGCPDLGINAYDSGTFNGQLNITVELARPAARDIVVVATPETSGDVLQTTISPAGGRASITSPVAPRWYKISVSAVAPDGQRCDVTLRICF